MKRGTTIILALVLLGIGVAAGAGGMWLALTSPNAPSEPISAPTLSLDTGSSADDNATQIAQVSEKVDGVAAQVSALEDHITTLGTAVAGIDIATEAVSPTPLPPTATPQPTAEPTGESTGSMALSGRSLYRIDPDLSEVRFVIDEQLLGAPNTVVGATNQIAGDIIVNFDQPATSQVGEIRINARTLETDDENRNRSLRGQILQSNRDEFEYITFVPTALSGLPDSVSLGEAVGFKLTGDLTIRHVTNPVTFDVTATMVAEDRLDGTAKATVTRDAYELTIPDVPGVANVSNDVGLEIQIVAQQVTS